MIMFLHTEASKHQEWGNQGHIVKSRGLLSPVLVGEREQKDYKLT